MSETDKLAKEIDKLNSQLQRHSVEERRDQIRELVEGLAVEGLIPTDEEHAAYSEYIEGLISFKELATHFKNIPQRRAKPAQ